MLNALDDSALWDTEDAIDEASDAEDACSPWERERLERIADAMEWDSDSEKARINEKNTNEELL